MGKKPFRRKPLLTVNDIGLNKDSVYIIPGPILLSYNTTTQQWSIPIHNTDQFLKLKFSEEPRNEKIPCA